MRGIKRRINLEFLLVIVTSILVSILNSLHVILQWIANPPNHLFTGIAHYFADYFLYVSQMAQGANGSWIWATHQFTNEQMPSTWIYWFNVSVGHLGSLVGLSPFATYNIALIGLCFVLLIVWYKVSSLLYPDKASHRLLCFFLMVTATSFYNVPLLFQTKQLHLLSQFWYSPAPAFNRLGGVPHQIFQSILLLLLIICYTHFFSQNRQNTRTLPFFIKLLLIAILAFVTATANPIQAVLLVVALGLTTGISLLRTHHARRVVFILFLCVGLGISVGAILTTNHFKMIRVLEVARVWDLTQQMRVTPRQFLSAVGPIIIFIPFGIWKWIKNPSPLHRIFFFYGSLSLLFYASPIPIFLATQPLRWIHPVPYTLLPILATQGIIQLGAYSHRRYISKQTATIFFMALYLLLTIPSLANEIDMRVSPQKNVLLLLETEYNHVPLSTATALRWLKQQSVRPETSVVLTDPKYSIEILIPVLTNKISFTGHPIHTLYPTYKEQLRGQFFNGAMSPVQAKTFLQNHRVGFILATPSEQNKRLLATYPFLQKVFENDRIMIEQILSE